MKIPRVLAVLLAGVALVAACGSDDGENDTADGRDASAARTVEIEMGDTAFEPETIEARPGETVRFLFTNTGTVDHEAYIGDANAQADHEEQMQEAAQEGHGGEHGDAQREDAVTVEPGDTGELTYTFDDAGTIEIGCHQPGHYEAGMKATVEVA